MTAESFYRRAAFLPLVLPLVAAGVAAATGLFPHPTPVQVAVVDVAGFLAMAGPVGILPYALWVVVALAWMQPSTEVEYRRLSWLAPITIAVPFGAFMALLAFGGTTMGGALGSFHTFGFLALGVGYFYSILVNLGLFIAKRFRCVE